MKLKIITSISIISFFLFTFGIIFLNSLKFESKKDTIAVTPSLVQKNPEVNKVSEVLSESFDLTPTPTPSPQPSKKPGLDMANVSKHDNGSSCWIVISQKIYDVTDFINEHPGGSRRILEYCGKDASIAFSSMGGIGKMHSAFAQKLLESYLLGVLGSEI